MINNIKMGAEIVQDVLKRIIFIKKLHRSINVRKVKFYVSVVLSNIDSRMKWVHQVALRRVEKVSFFLVVSSFCKVTEGQKIKPLHLYTCHRSPPSDQTEWNNMLKETN